MYGGVATTPPPAYTSPMTAADISALLNQQFGPAVTGTHAGLDGDRDHLLEPLGVERLDVIVEGGTPARCRSDRRRRC